MKTLPAVCLMGPTACGKSSLAFHLVDRLSENGLRAEIVSVDSAQVYRGMDIGTAKPSAEERARIPHHLIDLCEPEQPYSAARFAVDARAAIKDVRARGGLPLLVGGTSLYFRALIDGLNQMPSADAELRARLSARGQAEGWPALHAELQQVDPETASRLHPNDRQRIQRALEVHALGGVPLSRLIAEQQRPERGAEFLRFALLPRDRAWLHQRIERRLDAMFDAGLIDEVRRLRQRPGLDEQMPSIRSVGYRQVWSYLAGEGTQAQARQRALEATRQMAKRQITWLRSAHEVCKLEVGPDSAGQPVNASDPLDTVVSEIHEFANRLQEST